MVRFKDLRTELIGLKVGLGDTDEAYPELPEVQKKYCKT